MKVKHYLQKHFKFQTTYDINLYLLFTEYYLLSQQKNHFQKEFNDFSLLFKIKLYL